MTKKLLLIIPGVIITIALLVYFNPNQLFTKIILRITGDYVTPQYETASSILAKVKNEKLVYDNLFRLKSYHSFTDFADKKISNIPFVQIYNKEKRLVTLASGNNCKWALMNFFSKMDSLAMVAGDSLMYNYVMDRLEPIDIKTNQDTFDYYILAGWANYAPKLSERLFVQTNEMKKSMNDRICLSYINFDLQKEWENE